MSNQACDFCGQWGVDAYYPVDGPSVFQPDEDIVVVYVADGWYGCATCRGLIAGGDRDGLFRRAVDGLALRAPAGITYEELVHFVRCAQQAFFGAKPVGLDGSP